MSRAPPHTGFPETHRSSDRTPGCRISTHPAPANHPVTKPSRDSNSSLSAGSPTSRKAAVSRSSHDRTRASAAHPKESSSGDIDPGNHIRRRKLHGVECLDSIAPLRSTSFSERPSSPTCQNSTRIGFSCPPANVTDAAIKATGNARTNCQSNPKWSSSGL